MQGEMGEKWEKVEFWAEKVELWVKKVRFSAKKVSFGMDTVGRRGGYVGNVSNDILKPGGVRS